MSDDLVQRLHAWSHDERLGDGMLLRKAAAEIERLRAEVEALRAHNCQPNVQWYAIPGQEVIAIAADTTLELRRAGQLIVQQWIGYPCSISRIGAWTSPLSYAEDKP